MRLKINGAEKILVCKFILPAMKCALSGQKFILLGHFPIPAVKGNVSWTLSMVHFLYNRMTIGPMGIWELWTIFTNVTTFMSEADYTVGKL